MVRLGVNSLLFVDTSILVRREKWWEDSLPFPKVAAQVAPANVNVNEEEREESEKTQKRSKTCKRQMWESSLGNYLTMFVARTL